MQIGMQAAKRLAGEYVEAYRDQRTVGRIENAMRFGDTHQLVAAIAPRVMDSHDLAVFRVGVVQLQIASLDLASQLRCIEQGIATELVHAGDEFFQRVAHDKIATMLLERLHGSWRVLAYRTLGYLAP